jgi:hypothetical protein
MSKEALAKVVQRAISDGAFRRQLSSDPATALRGFDLSADEAAAIRSGDAGRLTAMGVELRMSKAFTLSSDQATGDAVRPVLSNDLGASYTGAMTAGTNQGVQSGVNSALLSGTDQGVQSGVNSALLSGTDQGVQSGVNSALLSGTNRGEAILDDGGAAGRDAAVIPGDLSGAHAALDDANAEGFLASVNTGGDNAINPVIITTESPTSASVLTAGDGASASGTMTDANAEGFLTSVNTGGDNATDSILVADDDNISGAASPGESIDGPTIQQ